MLGSATAEKIPAKMRMETRSTFINVKKLINVFPSESLHKQILMHNASNAAAAKSSLTPYIRTLKSVPNKIDNLADQEVAIPAPAMAYSRVRQTAPTMANSSPKVAYAKI